MNKFAKLFESEKYGQILVKNDDEDGVPQLQVFFQPEGLGVCRSAITFTEDDDGYDKCDAAFEKCDLELAETIISPASEEA